jgi:oligosaccharide repeat unit polymerase
METPGFVFVAIWVFFIIFGINLLEFSYNYKGIIYILFLTFVSFLFSIVVSIITASEVTKSQNVVEFSIKKSRTWLVFAIILGTIFSLISLREANISITQITSLQSLLDLNASNAEARYSNQATLRDSRMQIFLVFVYLSPIIGGYHFGICKKGKFDIFLAFFSFFPTLIIMGTQNTKSGLIAAVFLFWSTYTISCLYKKQNKKKKNLKSKVMFFFSIVIIILLLFSAMLLRNGQNSNVSLTFMLKKFVFYAFGQVPTFDDWFSSRGVVDYGFGKNTFMGISNFFGLSTRQQGVYNELVSVGLFRSNIFTSFRGLIQDYNVIGSYIFVIFIMIIGSISYILLLKKRALVVASFLLLNVYFFILNSFLISPWTYMSYTIALLLFVPYIANIRYRELR